MENIMRLPVIMMALSLFFCVACSEQNERMELIIASANGDRPVVKDYIKKNEDLNFVSLKGDTPLTAAVYNGHLEIVKLLIGNGASPSMPDAAGRTPVSIALDRNQKDVYLFLCSLNELKDSECSN